MPHETTLITTIVGGLVLAFIFGSIANRFKLPPLVGYLFAGILVGPFTPGFIADQGLANQLSEIGVILLMFGVGLHFSLKDLMSVRALAIPGALVQIAFATLLGFGLGKLLGWTDFASVVFGLALSVASTVVLLKAMQDRRLIETERGRIAVGWLIVEDLAMVLALVLIPAFASLAGDGAVVVHDPFISFVERIMGLQLNIYGIVGVTIVKLAAFVGFMMIVGRRVIPFILHSTAHTGNRELFRLAVLAIALGMALGSSYLFGVSLALGAFFAGMILSESELSQRAAQETLPLRDAFAVLFFVSVGMLFDPAILLSNPLPVLATLFIIIIGKSIAAFLIVIAFKRPVATALTISASLAQIGEFSFILATMGLQLKILPEEAQALIVAGAILSIILNPIVFIVIDRLKPALEAKALKRGVDHAEHVEPSMGPTATMADAGDVLVTPVDIQETEITAEPLLHNHDDLPQPTTLVDHTVLVGYGRVGRVVADGLQDASDPFVVIEDADGRVAAARARGIEVVVGNAASRDVLALANVGGAQCLLIAIPNAFEAGQATEQCRKLNPTIRIIARAHSEDEEEHLKRLGADTVIMGEREIGLGMLGWLQKTITHATPPAPVEEPAIKLAPTENILMASVIAQPLLDAAVDLPVADAPPEDDQMSEAALALGETANVSAEMIEPTIAQFTVAEPELIEPVLAEPEFIEADAVIALPDLSVEPAPVELPGTAAEPELAQMPSIAPQPIETPPPMPVENPEPVIPLEAPPSETPGTDPTPIEAPVTDPKPIEQPEVPGQVPVEAPEPVSPPVEVPDQPVPEQDPTPAEVPMTDPRPDEIPADPEGGNAPKETPLSDKPL